MSNWKCWKIYIILSKNACPIGNGEKLTFFFILFLEDKNLLIFWKWPIYKSCSKMSKAKGIPFSSHIISCILCSPMNGGEHCIYSNSNACAGKGLHQQNLTRIIRVNLLNFSIGITVSWHALFSIHLSVSNKQWENIFLKIFTLTKAHAHTCTKNCVCIIAFILRQLKLHAFHYPPPHTRRKTAACWRSTYREMFRVVITHLQEALNATAWMLRTLKQ